MSDTHETDIEQRREPIMSDLPRGARVVSEFTMRVFSPRRREPCRVCGRQPIVSIDDAFECLQTDHCLTGPPRDFYDTGDSDIGRNGLLWDAMCRAIRERACAELTKEADAELTKEAEDLKAHLAHFGDRRRPRPRSGC
jgi:hypothetical protein